MTQEKQIMLKTTQTEKMIIHFSHKDFKKCAVMDKHLQVCREAVTTNSLDNKSQNL